MESAVNLTVRFQAMQSTCPDENVEANIVAVDAEFSLEPSETALVLVDVWGGHHLKSHYERTGHIMQETIRPCIDAARKRGVTVVYAPSPDIARLYPQWTRYAGDVEVGVPDHTRDDDWPPPEYRRADGKYSSLRRPDNERMTGYEGPLPDWWHFKNIAPSIAPTSEDFVVATGDQLHRLLRHQGLVHLIYAGFATNICVVYRDYGLQAMRDRGYMPILLRDCTTGIETRETYPNLALTKSVISDLERWFPTSDSAEFISACETLD